MDSIDSDSNNKKDEDKDIQGDGRIKESEFTNNNNNKKHRINDTKSVVDPRFKRLLWYLLSSTRGGANRAMIISFLAENPSNANQLSNQLRLDYKTITHHLDVLRKNGLIVTENEDSYGATHFISPITEKNYSVLQEIMDKIGKK